MFQVQRGVFQSHGNRIFRVIYARIDSTSFIIERQAQDINIVEGMLLINPSELMSPITERRG